MSLDSNLSRAINGIWTKPTAIGLGARESMRKRAAGLSVVRENIERGTEGGMSRENMELWKLAMILVLCGAMILSQCRNWSCTETIYSVSKLTFRPA